MNIDIYNKNCLDGLKEIQNDSFDLTITSPPYNMNLRIRNGQYCSRQVIESEFSNKYKNFSDNLPIQDFYQFHYDVLYELIRVSNLVFYNISIVTGSKRAFFKLIGDFSMELKEIIVWDKGHGQPAIEKECSIDALKSYSYLINITLYQESLKTASSQKDLKKMYGIYHDNENQIHKIKQRSQKKYQIKSSLSLE